MDTPGVQVVKAALEPLCGCLHDIFSTSVAESNRIRASASLTDDIYNSMGADITRGIAHRELTNRGEIDGWRLGGKHHLRGQVLLTSGMMRLRFLHEPRSIVPPPGRNRARKAYYRNIPFGQVTAFDAESSSMLAIWQVVDPELSAVSFRIVRPTSDKGHWYGPDTEVDLDFILPDLGANLSSLEFEQYDEGLLIALPEEEEGTGDDAATSDVS
jgi:hypothetical protein